MIIRHLDRLKLASILGITALFHVAYAQTPSDRSPEALREADTVRAVVSIAKVNHYLGADGHDLLEARQLDRTLEAYVRALDPRGDLLQPRDLTDFDQSSVAEALTTGDLSAVHALAAHQRDRLEARAEWVAQRVTTLGVGKETEDDANPWWTRLREEHAWLIANGATAAEANVVLQDRYRRLAARAGERTPVREMELFLDAYLASLDPHSGFRPPSRRVRGRRRPPADLFGIGATLAFDGDYVQLQRLLGGGAAQRSGLLNGGDRILSVTDGKADGSATDVVGWSIEDVANTIRGPRGSSVTLRVLPRGADESTLPATITLTRDRILLSRARVTSELVQVEGMAVGVIQVPSFYVDYAGLGRGDPNYESAASDVARAIVRLRRDAPALGAILLDLRGNGGGALIEAVRMVGLFIDDGPVVRVRHAGGGVEVFDDDQPGRSWDGPLAVLVDRYSASASEIVAAALQDYERATVIGELTYGKGSVQEPFDLNSVKEYPYGAGRVSLTTAQFFRVNGESTQLNGVVPDVSLPVSFTNGRYGERFEHWPLAADRIAAASYRAETQAPSLTSIDPTDLQTLRLWERRPQYLGQGSSPGKATEPTPASRVIAQREREAFRQRIVTRLGSMAEADDAPLPILWSLLVRQDALIALRALAEAANGPIAQADHPLDNL